MIASTELTHERKLMNDYDVGRRIEVLVDDFVGTTPLDGKLVLDSGCGVGGVTRALVAKGAPVVASTPDRSWRRRARTVWLRRPRRNANGHWDRIESFRPCGLERSDRAHA